MRRKEPEASIHEFADRFVTAKKRAMQLGVFVEDKELQACPGCGLMEDVSVNGILLTCRPESLGNDTCLRFTEMDKTGQRFRCPACGIEFIA